MSASARKPNRYSQIMEQIFRSAYQPGMRKVAFRREDIEAAADDLNITLPKNLGDVIYSFRYRTALPTAITSTAPGGEMWVIRSEGRALYAFELIREITFEPNAQLSETKVPDATPGLVAMYALSDKQALLARLRYNRLIDIFTGVACYSLQNHLRTAVPGIGQIETDELYVGVDRRGAHYVFPIQAKGGNDQLNIVQIEQDIALCAYRFPNLVCRPIGAQFMSDDLIALFEFELLDNEVRIGRERHYRLVPAEALLPGEIIAYRQRSPDD